MRPTVAPARRTAVSPDGTPIAYWQSGHGRPLLLVHGGMSDHTRWDGLLKLLEPHAVVCVIDRRGRGGSGDGDGYAIEREFEDVAAVIDAIAEETGASVDVFGHSYGALCAFEAALLTSSVRKLALYEPPTHVVELPVSLVHRLEVLVAGGRGDEAVELFFREGVGSSEQEIALLRSTPTWAVRVEHVHTLARELRAVDAYRFDPARFGALTAPTLLVFGGAHPPELLDQVDGVVAAFPNAEAAVLEGQAHMALDTAPELVATAVLTFLDRGPLE